MAIETFLATTNQGTLLASCTNIGVSDGTGYDAWPSGTTYNITPSDSTTYVNSLSLNPGDRVLFQADGTWNLTSYTQRVQMREGVLYGRYGAGANPLFDANNVTDWPLNASGVPRWNGVFIASGVNDVWVDGIDITGNRAGGIVNLNFSGSIKSGFRVSGCTVSNPTLSGNPDNPGPVYWGAGIAISGVPVTGGYDNPELHHWVENVIIERCVVRHCGKGPNEPISLRQVRGFVVRYNRSGPNGHASINCWSGSTNGEVYGNEILSSDTDPNLYCGASNTKIYDNWMHTNGYRYNPVCGNGVESGSTTGGPTDNRYTANQEWYNNIIEGSLARGFRLFVANGAEIPGAYALDNIDIHHNTFYDLYGQGTFESGTPSLGAPSYIIGFVEGRSGTITDWRDIVFRDNIIFNSGGDWVVYVDPQIEAFVDIRNNVLETGMLMGGWNGVPEITDAEASTTRTSSEPLADRPNGDWTPSGAAIAAASDGGDSGAQITWTCGV